MAPPGGTSAGGISDANAGGTSDAPTESRMGHSGPTLLPAKGSHDGEVFQWARHGHSERLREQFKSRIPPLIGWARPVFEQGSPCFGKFPSGLLDRCITG